MLVPMSKQSLSVNQSGCSKERRASVVVVVLEAVVVLMVVAEAAMPVEEA